MNKLLAVFKKSYNSSSYAKERLQEAHLTSLDSKRVIKILTDQLPKIIGQRKMTFSQDKKTVIVTIETDS